jgi:hypothetical protein
VVRHSHPFLKWHGVEGRGRLSDDKRMEGRRQQHDAWRRTGEGIGGRHWWRRAALNRCAARASWVGEEREEGGALSAWAIMGPLAWAGLNE